MSSTGVDQLSSPAVVATQEAALTHPQGRGRFVDVTCRTLDIVVSAVLLAAAAPLLLAIAIAVRLDTPGPAVFRQERVGRGRRSFTLNKFRSMHVGVPSDPHREFVLGLIRGEADGEEPERAGADGARDGASDTDDTDTADGAASVDTDAESAPDGAPYYKMIADPRVTRMGRLLRRSSLDELPQLWNVLRGDMSLVGPRPPIPYEVDHYPPEWFARFAVKPGITGLWQVSGRSQVTLAEMVRLDVEYAQRRSLRFNLWILVRTVPAVLGARGAW